MPTGKKTLPLVLRTALDLLCRASLVLALSFPAGAAGVPRGERSSALELPLWQISSLEYVGGFRLPTETYGDSSVNYAEGPVEYNRARNTLYVVGHSSRQAIAEFAIPELVNSTRLFDFETAAAPIQAFSTVLDRAKWGQDQHLDRIGGMQLVFGPNGSELLVNAYEYYDAVGDNTLTTLVVRNADDLARSAVDGFVRFDARAGASSGWISTLPSVWWEPLGGSHLTGHSSGIPILSRASVGPSAFAFDPSYVVGRTTQETARRIPVQRLLEFSESLPLSSDLSNDSGNNDLWTHLSRAVFGFVPPGTRTYLTVGHSGGHRSGVCYKCTQEDGNLCGGYCARRSDDYDHYYWLWDLQDLVDVRRGRRKAHTVRPYDHGVFPTAIHSAYLGGGAFDPQTGLLFLTVLEADREPGSGGAVNPPVVVVYRFAPEPARRRLTNGPLKAPP